MAGISITWTASSANYDISAQGFDDWALWNSGTGSGTTVAPSQRKSGGGSTIGSMTRTVATLDGFSAAVRTASWTGGTPTASGSNNNGIFNTLNASSTSTAGSDCSVTVPADTTTRRAVFYFDAYSSAVTLTCTLSDGSAGPTTNTSFNSGASAALSGFYTIDYSAASAAQTLTIKAVATTALAPFSDVEPQGIGHRVLSAGVTGTIAWTEANDTASVAGALTTSGTMTWAEANDAAAIAGALTAVGGAGWTESNDTASLTGTVGNAVSGSVGWTEASDTAVIAGSLATSSALSWVEASDAWAVAGIVAQPVSGALAWIEDSDAWTIGGTSAANAYPLGSGGGPASGFPSIAQQIEQRRRASLSDWAFKEQAQTAKLLNRRQRRAVAKVPNLAPSEFGQTAAAAPIAEPPKPQRRRIAQADRNEQTLQQALTESLRAQAERQQQEAQRQAEAESARIAEETRQRQELEAQQERERISIAARRRARNQQAIAHALAFFDM